MKSRTLLTLALCAGVPALAQAPAGLTVSKGDTDITIYGILDAGVANVEHTFGFDEYHPVGNNPQAVKLADKSATGMFNGGISQTRIGIKGSTNLGNGWKGVFTLESAINIPSGQLSNATLGMAQSPAASATTTPAYMSADSSISGQLFNRGANFGFSHETYGTLTIGRHTSFMLDIMPAYDALQGAQLFTPIGFSGSYGGGGATDNSRIDQSAKYRVKIGDFNLGILHKFSGDVTSSARGAEQVVAGYEHGAFGIQVSYEKYNDATSVGNPSGAAAQPLNTLVATWFDTESYLAVARYKWESWGFFAGYQKQKFTNPSNPTDDALQTSLYGTVISLNKVTPYTVKDASGASVNVEKDLNVYWLGVKYSFTKDFDLAVAYYDVKQDDFSAGNPALTSNVAGTSKFTSALLDYRFTKAFDVYAGYMNNKVADGMAVGFLHDSNSTFGLGARFAF